MANTNKKYLKELHRKRVKAGRVMCHRSEMSCFKVLAVKNGKYSRHRIQLPKTKVAKK